MSGMVEMKQTDMQCEIIENEPMSRHTSWRAGGVAMRYAIPRTKQQIQQLYKTLPDTEEIEWLGLGSNTLVRDAGFHGTIIAIQNVFNEMRLLDSETVFVGAGVADAKLARFCAKQNLAGAAFFAGIPGLIGGALAMNAGAWGSDTWSHVVSVETINRAGEIKQRGAEEFEIGYRHVGNLNGEWFIGATMRFSQQNKTPDDVLDIKELLARRARSQPTGVASCGSVFRNPKGDHAARLIEACGLKGHRIGGAVISGKHANFIINDNYATAEDIESLIEFIQQVVCEKSGITLQTEVKIIGERA